MSALATRLPATSTRGIEAARVADLMTGSAEYGDNTTVLYASTFTDVYAAVADALATKNESYPTGLVEFETSYGDERPENQLKLIPTSTMQSMSSHIGLIYFDTSNEPAMQSLDRSTDTLARIADRADELIEETIGGVIARIIITDSTTHG